MKTKFSKLVILLCFSNLVAFGQDIPYGTTMESWKITDFINDAYIDVYIDRSDKNILNINLQYNNVTFLSTKGTYKPNSDSFKLNRIYSKNGTNYVDYDWEVEYILKSKQFVFNNKKKKLIIFTMPARLKNDSANYKNRHVIMQLITPDTKYVTMQINDFLNVFK